MPSGRTHAAISRVLLGEDGREVQKVMDSTAGARGPAHRHDSVHSIGGAMMELAKQGQLTPKSAGHAALHLATDRIFDRLGEALPPGNPRRIGKLILEDVIQRNFGRRRR